jgi:hypothetical protein
MKLTLLFVSIVLLLLAVAIAQLHVVPNGEVLQENILFSIFMLAIASSFVTIFKLWKRNDLKRKTKSVLIATAITTAIFVSLPEVNKPEFIKEIKIADKTLYVYYQSCFPPDNACECDDYRSLIYERNPYLPITHLLFETEFYVSDIQMGKGKLLARSSNICFHDLGKIKKYAY